MARVQILDSTTTQQAPAQAAPPAMPAMAPVPAPSKNSATARSSDGRTVTIRKLLPIHKLRLFAIAGELAQNESWMSLAAIAFAVTHIDNEPITVNSRREIEFTLERLGEPGVEAAAMAYIALMPAGESAEDVQATARF
jgi:hypothetical protein